MTNTTSRSLMVSTFFLSPIVFTTVLCVKSRKDRRESRADTLINLFYVVFFSVATVAFFAIGFQYNNLKTRLVAFVGSYGAATIYSAIARLVVTLSRKDKQRESNT